MGRVVLYMFMTADGFIAGPQGEFDSYEPSSAEQEMANEFFRGADAIMFGRVCYQGFVEYWDALDLKSPTTPPLEAEFAGFFRDKPLVVVSRTLKQVVPRATLIADNVAAQVATLRQQMAGYVVLVWGPELLATLMVEGVGGRVAIADQAIGSRARPGALPRPSAAATIGSAQHPCVCVGNRASPLPYGVTRTQSLSPTTHDSRSTA